MRAVGLVCVFSVLVSAVAADVHCLNAEGKPVDWFIMYKLADKSEGPQPGSNGMRFAYVDAATQGDQFTVAKQLLTDKDNPLGRTLSQFYGADKTALAYGFYNDEPPPDKNAPATRAHSKGVVGATAKGGIWLIHSTPRFPDGPSTAKSYNFPQDEIIYGQTYFCLTFKGKDIDSVGTQIQMNRPEIYDSNMPASLAGSLPMLAKAFSNQYTKKAGTSTLQLKTAGGTPVVSFAKNRPWDKDLYNDLVAPYYKTDLIVETWMRPHEPNCCPGTCQYTASNVLTLSVGGYSFKETEDHSKWAISTSGDVVCVGDINRNKSQWHRGGGTMCFNNPAVHKMFRSAVKTTEQCPATTSTSTSAPSSTPSGALNPPTL